MRRELLKNSDWNVVVVDWAGGSLPLYTQATANTRLVGLEVAYFVNYLQVRKPPSRLCHPSARNMKSKRFRFNTSSVISISFLHRFDVETNQTLTACVPGALDSIFMEKRQKLKELWLFPGALWVGSREGAHDWPQPGRSHGGLRGPADSRARPHHGPGPRRALLPGNAHLRPSRHQRRPLRRCHPHRRHLYFPTR